METAKLEKRALVGLTLAALFFFVLISVVLLWRNRVSDTEKETVVPSPTTTSPSPALILFKKKESLKLQKAAVVLSAPKNTFSLAKKEPIKIMARLNSKGEDVVSFNLIFKFDQDGLDLVKINSLLSNEFTIFKKPFSDGMIIMGIKKISYKKRVVLNNSPLMELVFTPKKLGSYVITPIATNGKEKTEFATSQTRMVYPLTRGITLSVGP